MENNDKTLAYDDLELFKYNSVGEPVYRGKFENGLGVSVVKIDDETYNVGIIDRKGELHFNTRDLPDISYPDNVVDSIDKVNKIMQSIQSLSPDAELPEDEFEKLEEKPAVEENTTQNQAEENGNSSQNEECSVMKLSAYIHEQLYHTIVSEFEALSKFTKLANDSRSNLMDLAGLAMRTNEIVTGRGETNASLVPSAANCFNNIIRNPKVTTHNVLENRVSESNVTNHINRIRERISNRNDHNTTVRGDHNVNGNNNFVNNGNINIVVNLPAAETLDIVGTAARDIVNNTKPENHQEVADTLKPILDNIQALLETYQQQAQQRQEERIQPQTQPEERSQPQMQQQAQPERKPRVAQSIFPRMIPEGSRVVYQTKYGIVHHESLPEKPEPEQKVEGCVSFQTPKGEYIVVPKNRIPEELLGLLKGKIKQSIKLLKSGYNMVKSGILNKAETLRARLEAKNNAPKDIPALPQSEPKEMLALPQKSSVKCDLKTTDRDR